MFLLIVSGAIQGMELRSSLHLSVVDIEKGAFGSPTLLYQLPGHAIFLSFLSW